MSSMTKSGSALREALQTLQSGVELSRPDPRFDDQLVVALGRGRGSGTGTGRGSGSDLTQHLSQDLVLHFVDLMNEWCSSTERYLDESDRSHWDSVTAGPETELEYWRRRMQRLTSIIEQLKTKSCQSVILVLNAVAKSPSPPPGVDRSMVDQLMRIWRSIDVSFTEAANEAKDNVKYLMTLEKFIGPLQHGTPATVIDALPALLNSIKMIQAVARYYNTTERMTNLFMKITNQVRAGMWSVPRVGCLALFN